MLRYEINYVFQTVFPVKRQLTKSKLDVDDNANISKLCNTLSVKNKSEVALELFIACVMFCFRECLCMHVYVYNHAYVVNMCVVIS